MVYETISVDDSSAIAIITVNRPEVHNAINRVVVREIGEALGALRRLSSVGAVIFTGAGDHAFVAGPDITQLKDYDLQSGMAAEMQCLFDEIEGFEKPTIAAVNGWALGGGCELAMACDLRVAADSARFGLPETALAVLPGAGGTQRLARLVGVGRALEMILTGRTVDAQEALRVGLVTSVVALEALRDEAGSTASTILAKGPLATRLAKLVVRAGMDTDRRTGLMLEQLAQTLLYTTEDKREGAEAFLAKRVPSFGGR